MKPVWKKRFLTFCCSCLVFLSLIVSAEATTWEFGMTGKGTNPFMPRGYLIATEDGVHWLCSRFDNSGSTTQYTSLLNGLSYIDATKVDGSNYTLYAFTDRNPKVYQYLVAYKNGEVISDFASYAGAPGRLDEQENLGSGANWAIPIQGFVFEPGCYYEFAFQRGMQANNGITLVFSADGKGYIQNPSTAEELAKYDADKYDEYEFVTSYWREDKEDGSYIYNFNLVPMRFYVQTYADVTMWETAAARAEEFLNLLTPEDINGVNYHQENIDNLTLLLEHQKQQIELSVRKKLQPEAEALMTTMVQELNQALQLAKSSSLLKSDISILEETLIDAKALYATASKNVGTGKGQYAQNRVEALADAIAVGEALHEYSPQAEINNAITLLRTAIVQVYNSVVRDEVKILYDEASGVSVMAPVGALPDDAVLYVDKVEKNISSAQEVRDRLADTVESISFYRIWIMSGDVVVQPTAQVDVQIPLEGEQQERAVILYAADSADTLERLSTVSSGGYLVFQKNQLGIFALALRASTAEYLEPGEGETISEELPTETIPIMETTDIPLEQEPDRMESEMEPNPFEEEAPPEQTEFPPRPDPELLQEVDFSLDEINRTGQASIFLLYAGGLVLLAAVLIIIKALFYCKRVHQRK